MNIQPDTSVDTTVDVPRHAREFISSGFTVIPGQIDQALIAQLNASGDRALDAFSASVRAGHQPAKTELNENVRSARCFYRWEAASEALLDHPTVHALGAAVLGKPKLWDMVLLEAMPLPAGGDLGTFDWHRDFEPLGPDEPPAYMWMFFCLTDVTADNGGTWVLPGSQAAPDAARPSLLSSGQQRPAGARQITARAGDIAAINPQMFHAVGENRTSMRRRLLNVGLCRAGRDPLFNHWEVARPLFAQTSSRRLEQLLRTNNWRLERRVDLAPDGWPDHGESALQERCRHLAVRADARLRRVARAILPRHGCR